MTSTNQHSNPPPPTPPTPHEAHTDVHTSPDLSALFSPTGTEHTDTGLHLRDSVVADSEFGDVPLDDSHFSTVNLNARNSTQAIKSPPSKQIDLPLEQELDIPTGGGEDEAVLQTAKGVSFDFAGLKRLSASSQEQKRSSAAMIIHRLEVQRETEEKRASSDGEVGLQEGFVKMQLEEQGEQVPEGIDWGAYKC